MFTKNKTGVLVKVMLAANLKAGTAVIGIGESNYTFDLVGGIMSHFFELPEGDYFTSCTAQGIVFPSNNYSELNYTFPNSIKVANGVTEATLIISEKGGLLPGDRN